MAQVSVFVTSYNSGQFIRDTLESISAQTFKDFDVVVGDDGSTDSTCEIVREFEALGIEIVTGPHVGMGGSWARSLPHCRGEFVAIIAGDDRWLPNHLEVAVEALERHPEAALSYARDQYIDDAGEVVVPPPTAKEWRPPTGRVDPLELMAWNYIVGHTAVMRRSALEEIGWADPGLLFVDLDLFVRIAERHPIVRNDVVTAQYRLHEGGMSRDLDLLLDARLALYEKHLAGRDSRMRRRMESKARLRIAYRQLWPSPTRKTVAAARGNLLRALASWPAYAIHPLNPLMLAGSLMGPLYVALVTRIYPRFVNSRLKLRLQRVLGIAR